MADWTMPSSLCLRALHAFRARHALVPAALLAVSLLLPACNRDFSDPVQAGGLDTAGLTDEVARPDSVRVEDMTLTAGDAPKAPTIRWYPSDWPDKGYSLVSDDEKVVRIESGQVKPLASGGVRVTLITTSGNLASSFLVTVKSKPVPVDNAIRVISVTAKPLSLLAGGEAPAVLTWNPPNATDREFTLSTENPEIVGIKGGSVVARAAGVANVLVTARDGGKTAAFTVTVQEPDNRVRVQSISVSDLVMAPGSEAAPVIAWTPANATDKTFALISSDPAVVSVQGARLRAEAAGSAVVMVQPKDNPDKAAAFKVRVAVVLKAVTAPDMELVAGDAARAPRPAFDPADATDRRYRLASANPAVAAVIEDTLVRPVAPGEARVTLIALDGNLRHEFTVKVAARVVPVISVTVGDMTLTAGGADAAPVVAWNPADATDKGYVLSAENPSEAPPAVAAGGMVRPLRAGVQAFVLTPTGGGQPATFQVTVLTRLVSVAAESMLIDLGSVDRTPLLTWVPADIEDKTYDLATSDPSVVAVNGMVFSAAGVGRAEVTVTTREGARQARFPVQVVETACLDILQGRGPGAGDPKERKCCRETGLRCAAEPPVDTLPPDTSGLLGRLFPLPVP